MHLTASFVATVWNLVSILGAALAIFGAALAIPLITRISRWLHTRETVIRFTDLRPGQDSNKKSHEDNDQALTELFAAKLRRIVSIHDLAYHYCRVHFRNQEIYSSRTCADIISIWSQVEMKSLFYDDSTRLAIGSSPLNDDLGQITTAGPVTANLNLKGILQFLQLSKSDNLIITGSLQDHGEGLHLASQLTLGQKSWAWDLTRGDFQSQMSRDKIAIYLEELAYRVTNRILGQTSQLIETLPGTHFEKYSKLLQQFVTYIQSEPARLSPKAHPNPNGDIAFKSLCKKLNEFCESEPNDIRTYYMLFIVGVIGISRRDFRVANNLLTQANRIEPYVISAILQTGISNHHLTWKHRILRHFSKDYFSEKRVSKADHIRAIELAKGLANVNAALGFSYEQLSHNDEDTIPDINKRRVDLEDAANAYERAFEYCSDDSMLLSNQAEAKLHLSDLLSPKDLFLERRLGLRVEAEQLLRQACNMKRSKNLKYSLLRLGHFWLGRADFEQAINCFKQAWAYDPSFLIAARNLASALCMSTKYDQAISVCNQALHEVGESRSHFLNLRQIHGWIHSSRGWAYLRKARQRRLEITRKHPNSTYRDRIVHPDLEIRSWLEAAKCDFDEAIKLLSMSGHETNDGMVIPSINKLFAYCEESIQSGGIAKSEFMDDFHKTLEQMKKPSAFAELYQSALLRQGNEFDKLFTQHWMNHTFVPSEYYGFIEDLYMFREYLTVANAVSDDKRIVQSLVGLENACKHFGEELPSCFLGLNLLWYQRPKESCECWKQRCVVLENQLKSSASLWHIDVESKIVTSTQLNHELWVYLYRGLNAVVSDDDRLPRFECPSLSRVIHNGVSSSAYSYAIDLLAEAKYIGEVLIDRSPLKGSCAAKDIREQQVKTRRLREMWRPVNHNYYRLIRRRFFYQVIAPGRRIYKALKMVGITINQKMKSIGGFLQL